MRRDLQLSGSLLLVILGGLCCSLLVAEETIVKRKTPWLTSNIKGSPDPALPYRTQRVYSQVQLTQPTDVVWLPDAGRWIATQEKGQIVSFDYDRQTATAQPLLDLNELHERPISNAVSMMFHHDLANQPWCYVCYASESQAAQGRHFVRFKVLDPTVPTIDLSSRVELLKWSSAGHSGGSAHFGPDGYLYLSVGDGQPPYPPDELNTGQDLSDLESSILRIDVDHPTPEQPYRIPQDNPFIGTAGAREEIWAFGFRNPWKMAFNPETGDLFAGDVGWEMREMVFRIQRGKNYGWSIMEGSQPVKQEQPAIPISPPIFEHTHLDSRSITGGFFWQSDRLPELKGAYIYGDWMTGKVWGLKTAGDQVLWQKELVDTSLQIVCFMLDPNGEVLVVGYDGTIHELLPNDTVTQQREFPKRLSETGLFADVVGMQPEPGVIEYEISAHHWADGTHSRQWIAIPNSEQLGLWDNPRWDLGQVHGHFVFPADTVMAKTVSYFSEVGNPQSEKHLETQVLHLLGDEFRAYNYLWNAEQTDAVLQADVASETKLSIHDSETPGGVRQQTWHHSSRSECLLCHIWSSGTILGFVPDQLDIAWRNETQLPKLVGEGLFAVSLPKIIPLAAAHDTTRSLEDRARAYLALNCSNCHRPQGGGTANFNFDHTKSLVENKFLDAVPAQGDFGIADARVVAPGDPFRSIVLYRTLKYGRGHMPQFGSTVIDRRGVQLLHDWIASMSKTTPGGSDSDWKAELTKLTEHANSETAWEATLNSVPSAMFLSFACSHDSVDEQLRARIIDVGSQHSDARIRDLFEGFLPESQRVERLGAIVDEQALLAMRGSTERGKELFEQAADVNCRQCHQLGETGKNIGPDLSGVGMLQTPAELLESILRPSNKIDPKFQTRSVLTTDGTVVTGIVVSENQSEMVLSDALAKLHAVAKEDIDVVQLSPKSVMPEMLLSGLTAQQATDLLAFLGAQRQLGPLQHRQATIHRAGEAISIDGQRAEAAWQKAASVGDFVFPWWSEGDGERQQTDARMLWDDDYLYVSFYCVDKDVLASRTERDSDVYRDDCVEVFASPELDHPENYFNLEINARGIELDNYRPGGKEPEQAWNPKGILIACTVDGTINDSSDVDRGWTMEIAIPFRLFPQVQPDGHPQMGDRWRLNLNRLEDNMSVKSQWSQGDRNIPRFHTPDLFGFVEFVE